MGKKILLADDSITIQKVIELTFSDEDFDVVTVGNGRLAIEKVQEVRPDVVLCDVIMPEKDGYEVCDFIKRSPQLGATPVLLLTGAFEPFDQERAARVGCDGFLAKPFEPETLIAKVKELLSKAAARHAPAVAPGHEPVPSPVMAPPPPPPPPAPAATATPFTVTPVPVVAPAPPPFQAAPSHAVFVPEPPPTVVDEPEMAFIPDEPFEDLDTPSFDAPAPAAPEPVSFAPAPDPVDDLLPMTAEESESLSGSGDDASATVMFRADSLPWSSPAAPPARVAEEQPEIVGDLPGFEEIIEETVVETEASSLLMSPPPVFVPEPAPMPEPMPMPVAAVPAPAPVVPPPAPAPAPPPPVVAAPPPAPPVVVAPPAPPSVVPPVVVASPPPPPPVVAPAPPPPVVVPPPVLVSPPPVLVSPPPVLVSPPPVLVSPPVFAPAPPVFTPTPEPVVAPPPPPTQAPPPPPVMEASSFADVAAEIHEPEAPTTPSVAAQVDVPVDMVAQIAQRVVAQVSEKVVERIAWEVIPELAEALIKREIERLKAELQQLT